MANTKGRFLTICVESHRASDPAVHSASSIQVPLDDNWDLVTAKGEALSFIVKELYRYALTEALQGIGILK